MSKLNNITPIPVERIVKSDGTINFQGRVYPVSYAVRDVVLVESASHNAIRILALREWKPNTSASSVLSRNQARTGRVKNKRKHGGNVTKFDKKLPSQTCPACPLLVQANQQAHKDHRKTGNSYGEWRFFSQDKVETVQSLPDHDS